MTNIIEFTDLNRKKVNKFTRNLFDNIGNEWIFTQGHFLH